MTVRAKTFTPPAQRAATGETPVIPDEVFAEAQLAANAVVHEGTEWNGPINAAVRAAITMFLAGRTVVEPPEPEGFVVAGYEHDRLSSNWDGEVHPTRAAGETSLAECRAAGYRDWSLYALVAVTTKTRERRESADACTVERLHRLAATSRTTIRVDELRSVLAAESDQNGESDA